MRKCLERIDLFGVVMTVVIFFIAIVLCKSTNTAAEEVTIASIPVRETAVSVYKINEVLAEMEPEREPVTVWLGSDEIPLTFDEQETLYNLCVDYGIPYAYALAIIQSETGFDKDAVGSCNEVGLFQIHPVNWERMEEQGIDVFTTEGNMKAGVIILAENYEKFIDLDAVTMGYKCGTGRAIQLMKECVRLDVCDVVMDYYKDFERITSDNYGYIQK